MVYNVNDRLEHVGKRLKEVKFNTGNYVRGTTNIGPITFTHLDVDREEISQFDVVLLSEELRSFSFDWDDIRPLLDQPLGGDRIVLQQPRGQETYEVMPVNGRSWQYTTLSRNRIRVYCKEIK